MNIILAAYRLGDTLAAITFFARVFPKRLFTRRVIVINDRRLFKELESAGHGWELVEGTNSMGEFSAWQEGLNHLGSHEETVVLANDTVSTHRHFTWLRAGAFRFSLFRARGSAIVGFTDSLPSTVVVAGLPISLWVSTYCFALTAPALRALQYRVSHPEMVKLCVAGGHDEEKFFRNISTDLEFHLRRWLFRGWWYAGGPLTPENSFRLKRKAEAIISEKLLSAVCQDRSIAIIDPFLQWPYIKFLDGVHRRVVSIVRTFFGTKTKA